MNRAHRACIERRARGRIAWLHALLCRKRRRSWPVGGWARQVPERNAQLPALSTAEMPPRWASISCMHALGFAGTCAHCRGALKSRGSWKPTPACACAGNERPALLERSLPISTASVQETSAAAVATIYGGVVAGTLYASGGDKEEGKLARTETAGNILRFPATAYPAPPGPFCTKPRNLKRDALNCSVLYWWRFQGFAPLDQRDAQRLDEESRRPRRRFSASSSINARTASLKCRGGGGVCCRRAAIGLSPL